jgi:TfoX/Sxy family transcriptional regulator of competence genes
MAYNEKLAERIADTLMEMETDFEEKKMFGGLAFMINNKMCVGIVNDEMMLRVLDEQYHDVLKHNHVREMNFTGKTMKGFVFVEPEAFKTKKDLMKWIGLGVEFGRFGTVKSKAKKK